MESELSGIFRVKLVTKNIVRGSSGTQFMHMRVNDTDLLDNTISLCFLTHRLFEFALNLIQGVNYISFNKTFLT